MKYLITGGCGFVGSNLAFEVLRRNSELLVLDNLSRLGSGKNLEWLEKSGKFKFFQKNTGDFADVQTIIREEKPDIIFHLAGQVAMTTSISDPRKDFETNTVGTHNVLEAVRKHSPESIVVYSSTNKVYGDLEYLDYDELPLRYSVRRYPRGFDENIRLDFRSPYGCSKGAADQYMLDYSRTFGIRTIVFRHSSIYGSRQYSTYDQGWIGWFVQKAIETKNGSIKDAFTISGDGKQVRDVLFSDDLVRCYFKAIENVDATKGQVFNIGGGMENSLSLLELFAILEDFLKIKLNYVKIPWRSSDQKVFVADITKAEKIFGWRPQVDKNNGIRNMIKWVNQA